MQPAPVTRAPALAWLTAHAHTRNRFLAVLAYPVAFVVVLMYVARRGVYESDDRNGMVILARWRPTVEGLLLMGIMLLGGMVLCLISGLLWLVEPQLGPAALAVAAVWVSVGAVLLTLGQRSATPVSKQTPTTGEGWQVAALAQRPGTRLGALLVSGWWFSRTFRTPSEAHGSLPFPSSDAHLPSTSPRLPSASGSPTSWDWPLVGQSGAKD